MGTSREYRKKLIGEVFRTVTLKASPLLSTNSKQLSTTASDGTFVAMNIMQDRWFLNSLFHCCLITLLAVAPATSFRFRDRPLNSWFSFRQRHKQIAPPRFSLVPSMDDVEDVDEDDDIPLTHILSLRNEIGPDRIRLILASQSPRRREILSMMGLDGLFEAIPSPLDESAFQQELLYGVGGAGVGGTAGRIPPGDWSSEVEDDAARRAYESTMTDPMQYTCRLAEEKARVLAEGLLRDGYVGLPVIVIGSDTIVEVDGEILEKPENEEDARVMLSRLSGRNHFVHTGVALYRIHRRTVNIDGTLVPEDENIIEVGLRASFTESAIVKFASLTDEDIDAYIATGEPMDKAGSYGIQGIGGQFVKRIQGDFFTVSNVMCMISALV